MTIFKIRYPSDSYCVMGYLSLPAEYEWNEMRLEHHLLQALPEKDRPCLKVNKVAENFPKRFQLKADHMLADFFPAIVYCRGGIGRVGQVRLEWMHDFSQLGFVVFAPCYRGSEESDGNDEFGGAETMDVSVAISMLQSLPFVQKNRISLLGFSRGSINAAQAAYFNPSIHKLILWGGISHLANIYEERIDLRRMLKRVVGGTPKRYPERYASRSPEIIVTKLNSPILLVHGTNDQQVDFSHAIRMEKVLREKGKNPVTHFYYGLGHHLPRPIHEAAVNRMCDWLCQK
ncbi:alpha/beta hydrolase family protein [Alicyclobacillus tolerans]|uniref:Dipeptidyl aminopeptidase/acylaminoacyl peptidase n=1 Tax=Alicyclobacillus tolerans TaxID=90970 RepID=A0ABT9LVG0_9BACL|nr:prolyl oligopeptidase family serine peptidase [Alicyclobacillus tengchongensis]MDP9728181.1 dipeptidyl aminopeptidase/acylaminoacyl peptidase [Alicyclobacillus tengchongensis]